MPQFRPLLLAVFALALLLLTGCRAWHPASVDPVLKIGLVAPFEGEQRFIGYDVIYSARLAVRQINEAGGVGGYRLALVAYDDSTWPHEAEAVARALVIDQGVVAVLGHWNPETTAAAAMQYQSADLPFLPMGSDPFGASDPAILDETFRSAYQAITYQAAQAPGHFAGTTYDAMQLLATAIEEAARTGPVTRATLRQALPQVTIDGLTGPKRLP
jgi:branched-chain amino acid transport system substrate-binding protein